MSIRVQGPDGVINEFPDGTSDAVIEQALRRQYGLDAEQKRAAQSAASAAAQRVAPNKRTSGKRMRDVFFDTLNTSWVAEGYREGFQVGASADVLGDEYNKKRPFLESPAKLVGEIAGASSGLFDVLTGDGKAKQAKATASRMISEEKARRESFQAVSAQDRFWNADDPIQHGAAALVGALGASAADPLSYISWGRSVVVRMASQASLAGGADIAAQKSAVATGIQDKYNAAQTVLSAAAGGIFSSAVDLVRLGPKKFAREFLSSPENDFRNTLRVADELSAPVLSEAELPKNLPARPAPPEAPMKETAANAPATPATSPTVNGGPSSGAGPKAKGTPEAAKAVVPAEAPKAGPEADPWTTADWGQVRSEQRKAAAVAHLETLRQTIKPEHVNAFIGWLGRHGDEATEGFHLNRDYVDWDKVRSDPESLLGLHNALGDAFRATYDAAGDATRSWADTRRAATLFGVTLSDAAKFHADITGENGISGKMVALESIALGHLDNLELERVKLLTQVEDGDFSGVAGFAAAVQETTLMDAMARGAESEIGRALNILKMARRRTTLVNDLKSQMDAFNDAVGGGVDNPDKLKDVLKKMGEAHAKGPAQAKVNIRKMREMGAMDHIGYLMTGNLLSSFKTHIRNLTGTPIHATFMVAERYVAAGIGTARQAAGVGPKDRVTFREANAYVFGVGDALQDALRIGVEAFKTGAPVLDSKSSVLPDSRVPFAIDAERKAKWKANGLRLSNVVDIGVSGLFATTRSFAYRPSVAADEFFKTLARRMQLNALAYREAHYRSQLVDVAQREKVFGDTLRSIQDQPTDDALKAAKAYFKDSGEDPSKAFDPGSKAEDMAMILRSIDTERMAVDHAQLMTFQTSGPVVEAFDRALRMVPLVKYLYVNFLRTPMALLKAGMVDRNPALFWADPKTVKALSAYSKSQEDALARGGAEADLVLSRLVVGTGVIAMAWGLAASGNLIGKRGPMEKKDNVLPYSIRLSDGTWLQYTSLSPIAEPLGLIADLQSALRDRDHDDAAGEALMGALAAAIANNVTNKTFLAGLSDLMDVLEGPGYQTGDTARGQQVAKGIAATLAPRLMPLSALQRSAAQEIDPVVRDARTLLEQFEAIIPLRSDNLPAKRDFLGRPVLRPEGQRGMLQAFSTSGPTADPLDTELSRLAKALPDFNIDMPNRRYNEGKIDSREYSQLLETQGQKTIHPVTGMNMEQSLRALIGSPEYAEMVDREREYRLKKTISTFRSLGNRQVRDRASPNFMEDMVKRTGAERLKAESSKRGWDPSQATQKAQSYGLQPGDPELEQLRGALFPQE